nr:succinate dehydrogenase assembly factor 2 [Dongshaea marina]
MLELDVILMPFFEHEFESLSELQQQQFSELLTHDDPDLFQWFMKHQTPQEAHLAAMVELILERNRARRQG